LLFKLLKNETLQARQKDVDEIKEILVRQGQSFDFKVERDDQCIHWIAANGQTIMRYHITITAGITPIIFPQGESDEAKNIIVFPASRSRLIEYRLRQDPRLSEALESGWQFLKFRYLRWMITRENLDFRLWTSLLGGDPPAWDPPKQLQFF